MRSSCVAPEHHKRHTNLHTDSCKSWRGRGGSPPYSCVGGRALIVSKEFLKSTTIHSNNKITRGCATLVSGVTLVVQVKRLQFVEARFLPRA